ncbi:MAG: hypothetical protein E7Z89_06315 [Cyanobacteria bacterium SIG28]|nr:hypothetical protein [Cyanobacteria bacterium SIG28]
MDKDEQNVIKVYTSNSLEPLYIKPQESIAQVSATNNRAEYFAEQTKKLRDEVKVLRDETKEYAEKNADVTVEDINYVKLLIDTKQPCGDYALNSDIPQDVSELNNDLEFVKKSELQEEALPVQEGYAGMFLKTDGNNAYWENLPISLSLFDTILKDHILTYEESKGLALQGTYVYKEAIAGSRYGYPDFYNKVVEEFAEATGEETINGITIKVHSNGHKFYNTVDKDAIDAYFEAYGFAWFYGVDTENERIFLPRNNYFEQATGTVSEVGQGVEAGLPNITGKFTSGGPATNDPAVEGAFSNLTTSSPTKIQGGTANRALVRFDASDSNSIYNNSDTVQPNAVKKLLYICVGNTTNYEGITDVVNQGMEILEQVALKVNVDGTNLNTEGKSLISGLAFPSDKWIDLTVGASGTTYTAPANGWFHLWNTAGGGNPIMLDSAVSALVASTIGGTSGYAPHIYLPVRKGETVRAYYTQPTGSTTRLQFAYAEGEGG